MTTTISGSTGISTQSVTTDSGAFYDGLQSGTAVTASGTSVDFTGIPSWVKRITIVINGVSLSGTSTIRVRVGAGTITTTGYVGGQGFTATSNTAGAATNTDGLALSTGGTATNTTTSIAEFINISGNVWVGRGISAYNSGVSQSATTVTLAGTLDRVSIATTNGTDTFDAGTINIIYE